MRPFFKCVSKRPLSFVSSRSDLPLATRCFSTQSKNDSDLSPLYYEWIHCNSDHASSMSHSHRSILFLHGLLGNGRNIRTMAKTMVNHPTEASKCRTSGLLLDLTGHGKSADRVSSASTRRKVTFGTVCEEIAQTLSAAGIPNVYPPLHTAVGHSLGGRLALEYAVSDHAADNSDMERLILLDTVPIAMNGGVLLVLDAVNGVIETNKRRDKSLSKQEVTSYLTSEPHGLSHRTAAWLSSQYYPKVGTFSFDYETARDLIEDFPNQNFLGLVEDALNQNIQVDLVRAGRNPDWTNDIIDQLEELERVAEGQFRLHMLPKAGHWVHIDDLDGLIKSVCRQD